MRKLIVAAAAALMLAGCTQAEQGAVVGSVGGALIGGAVGGTEGALIGAVAGGAGGYLLGRTADGQQCRYRHARTGQIFVDRCY